MKIAAMRMRMLRRLAVLGVGAEAAGSTIAFMVWSWRQSSGNSQVLAGFRTPGLHCRPQGNLGRRAQGTLWSHARRDAFRGGVLSRAGDQRGSRWVATAESIAACVAP